MIVGELGMREGPRWISRRWLDADRLRRGLQQGASAAVAFGARSLQQITTFVLTLLAAGFLSPAEYGVYTIAILFVTFLQSLIYSGFFHYVVRAKGDEREILDTCLWLTIGLSVAGGGGLALGAPALARAFNAPDLELVLRLLAALQPITAVTAWCSSVLMRHGRMRLHFNIMIAQNLCALVAGVAILFAWQSVFALVAYRFVRALSGALLCLGLSRVRPGMAVRRSIARDAVRYSYGLYGTQVLNFFSNYGADLVLGLMYSTAEAGLYRFGNRMATGTLDIVAQPMRAFALAQFGAANREDRPFGPVLRRFCAAMLILMGFAAATIVVFAEDVVRLFFQPAYGGALVVTYALAARALLGLGSAFVEPVLAAAGRTGAVLAHNAVWTSAQALAIPLAAGFGLGALACAQAAVAAASTVGGLWVQARLGQIDMRPVLAAMARASVFVLGYAALAYVARWAVAGGDGLDRQALLLGLALSGLAGVATLLAAIRWRVLELRVFSD